MNPTVNPCDNFYEFACGGMLKRTIPESEIYLSPFYELNNKMTEQIRVLLEKYNQTSDGQTSSGSVAYSAYLYRQCMAKGNQSNEAGLADLKAVVRTIFGDRDWNIGQSGHALPEHHSWDVNFVKAFVAGVSSIFQLVPFPDQKNVTANGLYVSFWIAFDNF